MTTLREAAQQALEALEIGYESASVEAAQYHAAMAGYRPERHALMDADVAKIAAAITAVKAALAQEEQEPVARMHADGSGRIISQATYDEAQRQGGVPWSSVRRYTTPLYAHPPRREWRGLSEEEIDDLSRTMVKGNKSVNWLTLAILAALKEKNHG